MIALYPADDMTFGRVEWAKGIIQAKPAGGHKGRPRRVYQNHSRVRIRDCRERSGKERIMLPENSLEHENYCGIALKGLEPPMQLRGYHTVHSIDSCRRTSVQERISRILQQIRLLSRLPPEED